MDFETELKLDFLQEATRQLQEAESCYLQLEKDPQDQENLNFIFRLVHNLKGSSKAVGFDEFGLFTHELETYILKIKNGQIPCNKEVVNTLLKANDHIKFMVDALKVNMDMSFDSSHILAKFSHAIHGFEKAKERQELKHAAAGKVQEKKDHKIEDSQGPAKNGFKFENVTQKQTSLQNANRSREEFLRVSLDKVEGLINNLGEMVILQSLLDKQAENSANEELKKIVRQISKIMRNAQDSAMSLRMTPVKPVFQKMLRIVRDTSEELGKDVSIKLVGENTEIDKIVLERIGDPLVHLIRNSIDHGIESEEVRLERGKNKQGSIELSAFHRSGFLFIEIKDDGGGLNTEKIRKIAESKGLISPDQQMSESEIHQLIFLPGFSTKDVVTEVSGRGVGMDVVKSNITELGGRVVTKSERHKGSLFQIMLPLTTTILDAIIAQYGDSFFAIPLNQIQETIKPKSSQISKHKNISDTLMLREENIPMAKLGDFYNLKSERSYEDSIGLIVRRDEVPICVLVDDLLYQTQVVSKPLGVELKGLKGVSGSTILGDGKPALILEPEELVPLTSSNKSSNNSITENKMGA